MKKVSVAIVGGGVAGLYAAYLLEKHHFPDYVVLEARPRLGGRLLTESVDADRYDLGATWYWPQMQAQLHLLVQELGLSAFPQNEAGMMVVEQSIDSPVHRVRNAYPASVLSLRLTRGMTSLVEALASKVPSNNVLSSHRVTGISLSEPSSVLVQTTGPGEEGNVVHAEHVLLAIPPRLSIDTIEFQPSLPSELARAWSACPTWMAPHAKYVAVYPKPFWRDLGLSGGGRSQCGPLVEIHDASPELGQGALFGFIGISAAARQRAPHQTLLDSCRAQMVRLFGAEAAHPEADWVKDWSRDEFTATTADVGGGGGHASAPATASTSGVWQGRITGIASEWSPTFPGYLAGAIDAPARGLTHLLAGLGLTLSDRS